MVKVILRKTIEKIGKAGQVISVKDGFARNYLLPRGLAFVATEENIQHVELESKKLEQKETIEKSKLQELAEKLKGHSCTLSVEAHDEMLYGSVSAADIARALADDQITINEGAILLQEPIKRLGIYEIPVRLHPDVTTAIKLWVVKK